MSGVGIGVAVGIRPPAIESVGGGMFSSLSGVPKTGCAPSRGRWAAGGGGVQAMSNTTPAMMVPRLQRQMECQRQGEDGWSAEGVTYAALEVTRTGGVASRSGQSPSAARS
jgi:hypothetical protein